MVTFDSFTDGDSIEIFVADITTYNPNLNTPVKARIKDADGTEAQLMVFDNSNAANTDWEEGVCYEISKPNVEERRGTVRVIARKGTDAKRTGRSFESLSMDDESHPAEGVSLLHVSDTHLGYDVYGLEEREADLRNAFTQLIEIAIDHDVDAVVHTGDLTHEDRPDEELNPEVRAAIERLGKNGIDFYYILGNHDFNKHSGTQAWTTTLDRFDHVAHLDPDGVVLGEVTVFGMDYQDESSFPKVEYPFSNPETERSVVCLHQSGYPIVEERYAEVDLQDFVSRLGFTPDAILLGHSHYTEYRTLDGGVEAICAGSPERMTRGYSDARTVVNKITVTDDEVVRTSHDLDTRPFKEYTLKIDRGSTEAGVDLAVKRLDVEGEVVTASVMASRGFPSEIGQAFRDAGAIDVTIHEIDDDEVIDRLSQLQHGVYQGMPDEISLGDQPLESFDFSTPSTPVPKLGQTPESELAAPQPEAQSDVAGPTVLPSDVPAGDELEHAYTARSQNDSERCGFVFRPATWEETTGTNSSVSEDDIEVWECPHDAPDGDYCIFHRPLDEKQPGEAREALLKAVSTTTPNGGRLSFIGASFHNLEVDSQLISAPHNAAIDLRHALVSGAVSLKRVTLNQSVDAREARFDDEFSFLERTRINGRFTAVRAVFCGDVEIEDTEFQEKCILTNAHFCQEANFKGTYLKRGAYFSRSRFEGKATYRKVRAMDNVTFYDAAFESAFSARRATFAHDVRFNGASFGGSVNLTDATVEGLAMFKEVEVTGEEVEFDECTFDAKISMAEAEFRGTDVSFDGTTLTTVELKEITATASRDEDSVTSTFSFDDIEADRVNIADGRLDIESISFDEGLIDVLVLNQIKIYTDTFSAEGLEVGVLRMPDAVITAREMSFEKARCRDSINAESVVLAASDTIDCRRLKVENEAGFESAAIGAKRIDFRKARFLSIAKFTKATILGTDRTTFENVEFGISASFDETTLYGQVGFNGARFEGSVSFDSADLYKKSKLDLSGTVVSGQTIFSDIDCEGVVAITEADLEGRVRVEDAEFYGELDCKNSTFEKAADFSKALFKEVCFKDSVFNGKADFTKATFITDPQFQQAKVANAIFKGVKSDFTVCTLDFSGAQIARGVLTIPETGGTLYNLEDATLGDVSLTSEHPDGGDTPILNRYKILETHYDGFDFVEHEEHLLAVDWEIHRFVEDDYAPDSDQLERTYLNAKTGAGDIGYGRGEGEFFTRHMDCRGERLKDTGPRRNYAGHYLLKILSEYGENPTRVFLTALGIAILYAFVFFTAITLPSVFTGNTSANFILFGDAATIYNGLSGALLISLEAFTTLVFGGTEVESGLIRLIAATEGFLGAFYIALFLFTLTKYIDR